ncbi:hypothetical protein WAI453_008588 [Rhynchosporium graminicola]
MAPHKRSHETSEPEIGTLLTLPGAQIEDLAVKLNGWALRDGMQEREINQTITARPPSRTLCTTVIANYHGKDNILFRNSMNLMEGEIAPPTNISRRYLIVGYAILARSQGEYSQKNRAYQEGDNKSIGGSVPLNVISWDSCLPPCLVVTEVPSRNDGQAHFWALILPRDGMCTPFIVKGRGHILQI